jgi:hypothetical protein
MLWIEMLDGTGSWKEEVGFSPHHMLEEKVA